MILLTGDMCMRGDPSHEAYLGTPRNMKAELMAEIKKDSSTKSTSPSLLDLNSIPLAGKPL